MCVSMYLHDLPCVSLGVHDGRVLQKVHHRRPPLDENKATRMITVKHERHDADGRVQAFLENKRVALQAAKIPLPPRQTCRYPNTSDDDMPAYSSTRAQPLEFLRKKKSRYRKTVL